MTSSPRDILISYSAYFGTWTAERDYESIGGTIEIVMAQVEEWMREDRPDGEAP